MKLTIIGTGYVGLVTGTCFAEVGHQVICVDNDAAKVKLLKSGGIPIYEPGLEELVKKNVAAGRLSFTDSTAEGIQKSDVIFIAVPTPPQPDGSVDLSFIERVARDIAVSMTEYKIIVDKSTVPVKTGDKVAETIRRYCKAKVEFDVVSNPEFLREGFAVGDLMKPDRIVIGVRSPRPVAAMKEIYTPFQAPIIVTDINSAELIKHAANSFLALKISYINAIASICEVAGANVQEVAEGIGLDERIGRRFLNAGIGFGGSCFPKDLSAFIKIAEQIGYDFKLLKEVQHINSEQMDRFVKKITDTLWVLKDKTIGVLGLAFKQNTDDIRSSPAIDLCLRLLKEGAILRVHDPKAMDKARAVLPNVTYVDDMNAVAEGCDALVVATEWEEFKKLDLARAQKSLAHPILFDGRNLFDPAAMEKQGVDLQKHRALKLVDVSAALIFRDRRLLIAQRRKDSHLGGLWEFPGGKREPDETFEECLVREIREELGVEISVGPLFEEITHEYPGKTVHLKFFICRLLSGEPKPIGCAAFEWIDKSGLSTREFPAADARLLEKLQAYNFP